MQIWTSTVRYEGPDRLDVTVKSGDQVFAPTWDMVLGYKSGILSKEKYTEQYTQMMADSWMSHNARWREVLAMPWVTLCCYCRPGEFCHRVLLAKMLAKACRHLDIVGRYRGERRVK